MKRELVLAVGLAAAALLGAGVEAVSGPVEQPQERPAPDPYVERAVFCPPAVDEDGAASQMTIASATGEAMPLDLEAPDPDPDASPPPPRATELGAGSIVIHRPEEGLPANAVGYGAHPVAGVAATYSTPAEGAAGTRCSERPSDFWYFPAGSSALGYDERLLLYNPFSDETSARVTFFTPSGESSPAGLDTVSVPSLGWEEIRLNEFAKTQNLLSVSVEARRGRVIAWRVVFGKPERGPRGVGMSLGATDASSTWYFPAGFLGEGVRQGFTLLNPNDEDAVVTVTLVSGDRSVQVPDNLLQISVPARTSQRVSLDKVSFKDKSGLTHVSAVLASTTEDSDALPIVVERSLSMDVQGAEGLADEVGLTAPAERWLLPPPAQGSSAGALAIYNSSSKAAFVRVSLLTQDGAKRPKSLERLRLPSGGRLTVPLAAATGGEPTVALVEADQVVVAERFAYSTPGSDITDAMGRALAE